VQNEQVPSDWKPMATVGKGLQEIRIRDDAGTFRMIHIAKFSDAVYVLHCLQKKTHETNKSDLELAAKRYADLVWGARPMSCETFVSVWDTIEDTLAEAENMKLRSSLMMTLDQHIRAKGWTQAETARRLGVTQPRVSDLLRGKINLFSVDSLINMLAAAGLHVEVRVR
jgi:predicted XRE-type DNA-binding protein